MKRSSEGAQAFARDVAAEMARLRGWGRKPSREVTDDIFATMARHDQLYTRCFSSGIDPKKAAKMIQDKEWGS